MAEYSTNLDKLAEAQAKLKAANDELFSSETAKNIAKSAYTQAYDKQQNGYCRDNFRAGKSRDNCQNELNAQVPALLDTLNSATTRYNKALAAVPIAKELVSKYENLVDSDIRNSGTLAEQGLTSTAVEQAAIEAAKGQAAAYTATGNAQAEVIKLTGAEQAKAITQQTSTEAANKKTMTYVIVAVVAVVVIGIGFFLYSKFKK